MVEYKQCIIIREDLKLSKGKLAVQVAHASVSAFKIAKESEKKEWENLGQKKVVLKVPSLNELLELKEISIKHKFPTALISDSGLTEVAPGTITVLGIGPANSNDLDKITKHLKLA